METKELTVEEFIKSKLSADREAAGLSPSFIHNKMLEDIAEESLATEEAASTEENPSDLKQVQMYDIQVNQFLGVLVNSVYSHNSPDLVFSKKEKLNRKKIQMTYDKSLLNRTFKNYNEGKEKFIEEDVWYLNLFTKGQQFQLPFRKEFMSIYMNIKGVFMKTSDFKKDIGSYYDRTYVVDSTIAIGNIYWEMVERFLADNKQNIYPS
jgi:hypothetical protein